MHITNLEREIVVGIRFMATAMYLSRSSIQELPGLLRHVSHNQSELLASQLKERA